MARPEYVTNYRSSLIPIPQIPWKAPPPRVEHPVTPRRYPRLLDQRIIKNLQEIPFPTTGPSRLPSRVTSVNFQPGTQPHLPDQIQLKIFSGNLHGPARVCNQLPLEPHSHTPDTLEGATPKGGTSSDATAVPTTVGPTHYKKIHRGATHTQYAKQ